MDVFFFKQKTAYEIPLVSWARKQAGDATNWTTRPKFAIGHSTHHTHTHTHLETHTHSYDTFRTRVVVVVATIQQAAAALLSGRCMVPGTQRPAAALHGDDERAPDILQDVRP